QEDWRPSCCFVLRVVDPCLSLPKGILVLVVVP
ncbi:hypothetical protein A2U01_0092646, partial [Trifolium medium]|nr:hypothetical protein [Trifolium medium]